ncbi:PadR family transcriptional regulator [Acinetobacter portensis]|uniref:PadR family transcriptional regulator n=2 Tax=Acinetobacter TaxID=469 RepID=A0A6L6GFQ0_9GAMM|nr:MULTISPECIES: PadR family transcriptional regulator [Acinetobacter]MCK7608271.1 PadR family transcriptional regulator [Acinetobacter portensis]MCK7639031.1 PadR family transcriptional regulator [Acinetobacter portensis]MDY6462199.1 PadR family transcriptional regulator [Acinetobacter faecalis]MDY6486409.1 PadR family transcriptional regulator [Acinetobacter faecalis]MDY6490321.1 PadR family transcriptional regulator [Acinetobacter faecalis]
MPKSEIITEIDGTSKPRKRLFETGEMKLLVLHFISQQPKFSYDIIKDVANLVGGNYKPSTGTICPTINYLEEQGYTEVHLSEDGRKQYHINSKGIEHLQAQKQKIDKTLCRFNTRIKIQNNTELTQIKEAMDELKASLRQHLQDDEIHPDKVASIAKIIHQAAMQIKDIG